MMKRDELGFFKFLGLGILFLMQVSVSWAQSDSTEILNDTTEIDEFLWEEPKSPLVSITGYVKELATLAFESPPRNFQYDNLIHNRFNSYWTFSDKFKLQASLRTRLFNGATPRNFEGYGDFLSQDNGLIDLSWTPINSKNLVVHSTIDRLYFSYSREKWELSIGRQRINWGRTYIWNPNDLFNTYSYLDFDYEERPGTDAIRFQYYKGYASGFEIAVAPRGSWDETVAAFLWKFNKKGYDFQLLAGNYLNELAWGAAWAGDIKGLGFKGELSYFRSRKNFRKERGFLSASVSLDVAFPNSLYIQTEFLYNGNWRGDQSPAILFIEPLPANNLFPAREILFVGLTYQLHPLISGGLSTILAPGERMFIYVPSLTISLKENIDLLITAQLLRNKELERISPTNNLLFGRLKWSF